MAKPTKEEYDQAVQTVNTYAGWIRLAKEEQDKLLDQIVYCRERIAIYEGVYNSAKEIKDKYEIYEELEGNAKM